MLAPRVGGVYLTRGGGRVIIEGDFRQHIPKNQSYYYNAGSAAPIDYPFYGKFVYEGLDPLEEYYPTWTEKGRYLMVGSHDLDLMVELNSET